MPKITQKHVKAVAFAFGFTAVYNPAYREWRICSKVHKSDSYFTNDAQDAIDTLVASYNHYRLHNTEHYRLFHPTFSQEYVELQRHTHGYPDVRKYSL